MARWRHLHELSVVSVFLANQELDVSERYLRHRVVDAHQAALKWVTHADALGVDSPDEREVAALQLESERLVAKYGKEFGRDWGWAAAALGTKSPKFTDIEKATGSEHLRPFFKLACQTSHAGPQGLYFELGIRDPDDDRIIAGPINSGFTDPARFTARSLTHIAGSLALVRPSIESLATVRYIDELAVRVAVAFAETQDEVEALGIGTRLVRIKTRLAKYWSELWCRVRHLST